jgi:hypothetical protein
MRRFLNKLFRDLMTTSKTQGDRPASRRTMLQLNGLEDRMVLSTASLNPSHTILTIDASAGGSSVEQTRFITLFELNPGPNRQIEVFDSVQGEIGQFSINPINHVVINVNSNDTVVINDSSGMPFATGSTITLNGSGSNDSIVFDGSRSIDTGEDYIVGGTAATECSLLMDGLTFQFNSAFSSVTDTIQITGGPLDVATGSQDVFLSNGPGSEQTFSGMGPGGGGILTYANMSIVELNEYAADATVNLDATTPEALERDFIVDLHGAEDQTIVATTPNSSSVLTWIDALGSQQRVSTESNLSPVLISGDSSTTTVIGTPVANDELTLADIKANVSVVGSGTLIVSDSGNHTLSEDVTVTESTISGLGLFGNNAARISFVNVPEVSILSGTASDIYNLIGANPGESTSQISIFDDSTVSFAAIADVDTQSHLSVQLFNQSTNPEAPAALSIDDHGGKFSNPHPKPGNGVEDVHYSDGNTDQFAYFGFTSIKLEE